MLEAELRSGARAPRVAPVTVACTVASLAACAMSSLAIGTEASEATDVGASVVTGARTGQSARGSGSGVSRASTSARRESSHGGRMIRCPS
ncbi:MAG: hypothetical protein ACRDL8_04180, partial [Solirubrobacteraceae bacterium]